MSNAPPPETAGRQNSPEARKPLVDFVLAVRGDSPEARRPFFAGIVFGFVLAILAFLGIAFVHANLPYSQGPGNELWIVPAALGGPSALGWYLHNKTRTDIRWLTLLVWAPLVLSVVAILIVLAA